MQTFLELLPVLLLLLICGLFAVASLIALIVIFCTKNDVRTIAVNCLLGFATVPIVTLVCIPLVSHLQEGRDSIIKAGIESSTMSLNLAAITPYAEKRSPLLKAGVDFGYPLESEKTLLKETQAFLKERTEHRPKRKSKWFAKYVSWCAEYALVTQALGEDDAACLIVKKARAADSTGLIDAVEVVTCQKDSVKQANDEEGNDNDNKNSKEEILATLDKLPKGWYRDTARLLASKHFADSSIAQSVESARNARSVEVLPALMAVLLLVLGVNVLGVVALFLGIFCRTKLLPNRENFHSKLPNFRQVYGIFLFTVYFQLLVMGIGWLITEKAMGTATAEKLSLAIGVGGLIAGYFTGLYFFLLRGLKTISAWELLALDAKPSEYLRLVVTGVGTFGVLILFDTVWAFSSSAYIHNTTNNPVSAQLITWSTDPAFGTIAFSLIAVGLLAPIGEEVIFRALLFGWLRKRFSVLVSVLISGSIFAFFHADPGQLVQLTAAGCLFAFVYERTRSLIPTIVAHACMNSTSVIITFLMGYAGRN
ncbi:MAG TPA: type II CAAX endopeptidase family protein [Oculatellaceae cyanobacterium]